MSYSNRPPWQASVTLPREWPAWKAPDRGSRDGFGHAGEASQPHLASHAFGRAGVSDPEEERRGAPIPSSGELCYTGGVLNSTTIERGSGSGGA